MPYDVNFKTGKLEPIDETACDKNALPVGTVLHLNGYNYPNYVITNNQKIDARNTSYGASYDCVNLDNGEEMRKQAYTLEWLKDKKSDHIQTYITDQIMTGAEMAAAIEKAKAVKAANDQKAKEEADRRANDKATLPARFPYLTPGTDEKAGAMNIRTELKRAFPAIKFSVKIKHRGSSSININWTDGPTSAQVKTITGKYQEGNFNGMEDIYEYNRAVWPEVFGGARYVFENRHTSADLILKAALDYGFNLGTGESDNYGILPGLDHDKSQMIYRHAREMIG